MRLSRRSYPFTGDHVDQPGQRLRAYLRSVRDELCLHVPMRFGELVGGTLVQMHHEPGMAVSFIVALALSGVAAAAAHRAIPEPTH